MNIELKPCPFCGEYPSIDEYMTMGGRAELVRIECPNIAHTVEVIGSPEFASKEWNTRAERTCRMNRYNSAVWACSECGRGYMESLLPEVGEYCMGCGAKVVEE